MDIVVGLSNTKKYFLITASNHPKPSIFSLFALIILIDLLYKANVPTLDDLL